MALFPPCSFQPPTSTQRFWKDRRCWMRIPERAQRPSSYFSPTEIQPQVTRHQLYSAPSKSWLKWLAWKLHGAPLKKCNSIWQRCLIGTFPSQNNLKIHFTQFENSPRVLPPFCLCRGNKSWSDPVKRKESYCRQIPTLLPGLWLRRQFWVPGENVAAKQRCGTQDLWGLRRWLTAEGILKDSLHKANTNFI